MSRAYTEKIFMRYLGQLVLSSEFYVSEAGEEEGGGVKDEGNK